MENLAAKGTTATSPLSVSVVSNSEAAATAVAGGEEPLEGFSDGDGGDEDGKDEDEAGGFGGVATAAAVEAAAIVIQAGRIALGSRSRAAVTAAAEQLLPPPLLPLCRCC